jgi:tetratricopeptide (TPR) repeat protein
MVSLTAKFPKDPAIRVAYLRMLLERGGPTEIDAAVRQLKQLVELAPNVIETRELAARVALKRGKRAEAVAALRGMLPRDLKAVKAEQLPLVSRVAQLMAEVEDYKAAELLLKLAADQGSIDNKLEYSDFIGRKVDADRGFELLNALKGSAPTPRIVQYGLSILRAREAEGLDPKWGEIVHGWVDSGLREDPDSIPLMLEKAELLDVEANYDEAAKEYRKLLAREELQGISRAVVLNNLAYLLAMSKEDEASMSEARRYCDEAVQILGPQSDILDTRAVISIAAKRYDDAIADMKLSVIDTPTASKHFHKALAHLGAGQNEDAAASWEEAQRLGLARDDLPPMERPRFDKAKAQLEGLGLRSAQL